jgi:GrpB-like predicted nucleotidyltransferase (UPF0157 family)
VPDPESPDLHFFAKPAERPRSHHLHLRAHADEAARYAVLKREAAKGAPQDRLAYIEAKEGYVRDLEARAVRWARARRVS